MRCDTCCDYYKMFDEISMNPSYLLSIYMNATLSYKYTMLILFRENKLYTFGYGVMSAGKF